MSRPAVRLTAINTTRGVKVTEGGRIADTSVTRMVGLLKDKTLALGDGLWIVPCNSIHSFFMQFNFDAVFLDRDLRVVHLISDMKPSRISRIVWSAHSVLELPAGHISQTATQMGDQFEMKREAV